MYNPILENMRDILNVSHPVQIDVVYFHLRYFLLGYILSPDLFCDGIFFFRRKNTQKIVMENGPLCNFHPNKTDNSKSSFPLFFLWEKNVNLQPIFNFGKCCCFNKIQKIRERKEERLFINKKIRST